MFATPSHLTRDYYKATPDLSHLTCDDYEQVYEPAEDSFLMLDALQQELDVLKNINPLVCLEIGAGSGVCITFLAQLLGADRCSYFATDISPEAVDVSERTTRQNCVSVNLVLTDLMNALSHRLAGKIDILLFNPPYVVTPSEEVQIVGIQAAWAGGVKGREVTDRILPDISRYLSDHGVFYLIALKENDIADIGQIMLSQGLSMENILSRQTGPERLSVLKFSRIH